MADELNALVAHNAEVVARARTHVGNLAHFLKTPLSVLANEVQGASGPLAETVARQVQVMRRQVDHYLARARTVGSAAVIGARTEVAPVDRRSDARALEDLRAARDQDRTRSAGGFELSRRSLRPRGDDRQSARQRLQVGGGRGRRSRSSPGKPGRLLVEVGDDGPGLDDDQKQRVIERGERLDQSKPGSGLGLGIVKEIASLYGGKLTLGRAEAGGLVGGAWTCRRPTGGVTHGLSSRRPCRFFFFLRFFSRFLLSRSSTARRLRARGPCRSSIFLSFSASCPCRGRDSRRRR